MNIKLPTLKVGFMSLILMFIVSSCASISYSPKISLDVSNKTINKTVQIDKLVDITESSYTKNPFGGLSVTNKEALQNSLDLEVTNAIVTDFSTNGVFKQVSRRVDNPDIIIKGEIRKFYGISKLNTFFKISYFGSIAILTVAVVAQSTPLLIASAATIAPLYLGVPISKNTSEVEITLKAYNSKGDLLGTYSASVIDDNSSNMYKNKALALPSMTNRVFSKTIMEIRNQIIEDYDKLSK